MSTMGVHVQNVLSKNPTTESQQQKQKEQEEQRQRTSHAECARIDGTKRQGRGNEDHP